MERIQNLELEIPVQPTEAVQPQTEIPPQITETANQTPTSQPAETTPKPESQPVALPKTAFMEWENSQYFKNILKAIETLADEAPFTVTLNGLECRVMDPSRVALIELQLRKESCREFIIENTDKLPFLTNMETLLEEVFKKVNKDERVRLTIKDYKLFVDLTAKFPRTFEVPLLEEEKREEIPVPKLSFTHVTKLVVKDVVQALEDHKDHVQFVGTPEELMFRSAGDITKAKTSLKKTGESVLDISMIGTAEVKATYNTSYLIAMWKVLQSLVEVATLSYATDLPLKIDAELIGYGTITFYLAPRIAEAD